MTEEKKTLSLGGTKPAATSADGTAAPAAKKGTLSLKGAPSGAQVITQTLARGCGG